ncbi:hypothetical protein [Streptomyces luteireticuli]|uniref:DUF3099 domain-containing protein n=1 Tax=Streptomyces luteireticuli TaxID=173858 RepID=A0ABP3J069_9ACTN
MPDIPDTSEANSSAPWRKKRDVDLAAFITAAILASAVILILALTSNPTGAVAVTVPVCLFGAWVKLRRPPSGKAERAEAKGADGS